MDALIFVIVNLVALSGGLVALDFFLKKEKIKKTIIKKCDSFGRYPEAGGEYVSWHPFHPNNICYIRAGLSWVGIAFYYFGHEYLGIGLYLIAVFLDAVDGMVARACDMVTEKGKKIDPLFDKLTYLIPVIILFPGITATYFFIFFETIGQFAVRKVLSYQGKSLAANNFGKVKALIAFSFLPYAFIVKNYEIIPDISSHLMVICAVLSACSAFFKLIPNRFYADILSLLNLLCGISGIFFVVAGNLIGASLIIILGQVFDFFDGRMAAKHGGTQAGPWLDDLADSISFGLCPSIMVWISAEGALIKIIAASFLFSIIIRLVRFSTIDKRRRDHKDYIFFGLPSPAGASAVMGVILVSDSALIIGATTVAISVLSVSTHKFIHLGKGIVNRIPKPLIVALSAFLLIFLAYLIKINSQTGIGYFLSSGILAYMIMSEIAKKSLLE
ncbi:MAG: CDP-alcohol phosphatidyltransferase family protein [Parcubacteria group bacterium]|jgi:CDP-diacylglycerol--serine O-phosphatidyltransferase|nr:CDP-alcohol phosphatidyltransferase family protein [Candidatus Moranbacteria bacterium]